MKQNYVTPIAEAIDLQLENNLLSSSSYWDSSSSKSSGSGRPANCPCNKCPYAGN